MSAEDNAVARRVVAKVTSRVILFFAVCYFVAYLDRVNVGFAAIVMNPAIGLTATMYGWGAGIFFVAYFIFGVPSNAILDRVGARRWIAILMVSWGIVSLGMAFVTGPKSFALMRFLLGVTESGYYPGVILLVTRWFPRRERAKMVGLFSLAGPVSTAIGSPISGMLLDMNGYFGLAGWQWLFIIEAAPAVLLGFATLLVLPDGPRDASWLKDDERQWLLGTLAQEQAEDQARNPDEETSLTKVFFRPEVWVLGLVFAGGTVSTYGMSLWLPSIIKGYGLTNVQTGILGGIPFACAAVAMWVWGRHSDRTGERLWHTAGTFLVTASALAVSTMFHQFLPVMIAATVATMSANALRGPFFALATEWVPPKTRGLSIASINALGNLGGFIGPFLIGWIKDQTGSFALTMVPLIGTALVAVAAVLSMHAVRERRGMPAAVKA